MDKSTIADVPGSIREDMKIETIAIWLDLNFL